MRILDRFLAINFLKNLVVGLAGLGFLFFFQSVFPDLVDSEFTAGQILTRAAFGIPQILVQMLPPAALLGSVLTLSGLARTGELTACYALGFGLRQIVSVFLLITLTASSLSLFAQDQILPQMHRKQTSYYWRVMRKRPDFSMDVKQDKIWYRSKNLIYNLRSFDPKSQTINGMAVYSFDERFRLVQLIDANRAVFKDNLWTLKDGTVTVFEADSPFPLTQTFEKKEIVIPEKPKDFQEIEKEVDGLRMRELWRYTQRMKLAGADAKRFDVKFHSRISISFIPLIMCILGVPFSMRGRREGGRAKDVGLCLAVTFFYWLFYSVGLSLGSSGAVTPLLASWLPSLIFSGLAFALIAKSTRA